jgi:hypothetical protein
MSGKFFFKISRLGNDNSDFEVWFDFYLICEIVILKNILQFLFTSQSSS